jgi:uncharacterized protein (DUF1697 family)
MHVALLRGINLGSRRLPMKELAAILEDAGCADVRTYIQSGNVVYRAAPALARRVPGIVEKAIAERYGFECPVVTRSAAEIDGVIEANPFPEAAAEPKTLHVGFLRDRPAKSRVAALDPDRSPPDAFVVRGREIYVHYPKGSARSKLTPQYFDPRLETLSTFRNWRTVLTLQEMLR